MEAWLRRATEETDDERFGAFRGILAGMLAGSAIWAVLLLVVLNLR